MADQAQETQEKQRLNCAACGKPVKRIKRYYRNGKFYCDKTCWRNALKKAQAKKEETQ